MKGETDMFIIVIIYFAQTSVPSDVCPTAFSKI